MAKCVTCNKDISVIQNNVIFNCIKCGAEIIRCGKCRKLGLEYACKCGFEGF